jgi:hypothetical protein
MHAEFKDRYYQIIIYPGLAITINHIISSFLDILDLITPNDSGSCRASPSTVSDSDDDDNDDDSASNSDSEMFRECQYTVDIPYIDILSRQ